MKGCKKNIVSESQTQALQAGSEGTAFFFQPEAEGLWCIPEATILRLCPLSWWNLGVVCLKSPRNIRIYNPSLPCNDKQGVTALMGEEASGLLTFHRAHSCLGFFCRVDTLLKTPREPCGIKWKLLGGTTA